MRHTAVFRQRARGNQLIFLPKTPTPPLPSALSEDIISGKCCPLVHMVGVDPRGHPCSHPSGLCVRAMIIWAACCPRPLQYVQASCFGGIDARSVVPWAAICSCPLQYVQSPCLGGAGTRAFVPRAAVTPCPFKNSQSTPPGCCGAYATIPGAAVPPCPFEHLELTKLGTFDTGLNVPITADSSRPLNNNQVSTRSSGTSACTDIPVEPV